MSAAADSDDVVRVLVVDDSDTARSALGEVVAATSGFTMVGSSSSGTDALEVLSQLDPDLVLLDVHMPGLSGPETARRMSESHPDTRVVLVSATPGAAESTTSAPVLPKDKVSPTTLRDLWVERADAAPTRARQLGEERRALTAQAEHRVRRARRNRRLLR